jgi:hypothetical protein
MSASTIIASDQTLLTRVSTAALPGAEVEARLVAALRDLDAARQNAVIWFGEILSRKLYLEFGCSSIHHYARSRLGFSRARTAYFLRLCRSFDALPALKESVSSGAVPWTKAREVVKVATPETESFWVEQAQSTGRRELERRVAVTQGAARVRRRAPGQGDLLSGGGMGGPAVQQAGAERDAVDESAGEAVSPVVEVPVTVSFQLSPEQYARYEAMLECARKHGARGSREELFLAAWEMLTRVSRSAVETTGSGGDDQSASVREARSEPRYQIVIRQCETCGRAHFLDVHHVVPRADGGSNDPDNLITLCAACHRMIHDRAAVGNAWPLWRGSGIDAHPGDHRAA